MLRRLVCKISCIIPNRYAKGATLPISSVISVKHASLKCSPLFRPVTTFYKNSYRNFHTTELLFGNIVEVKGPEFSESISEGDIRWLKQKGDYVATDDIVAEIETDKTTVEVPALQAGKIVELLVEDGNKVFASQKIYKLELGAEGAPAPLEATKTSDDVQKPLEIKAKNEPQSLPPPPPASPSSLAESAPVAADEVTGRKVVAADVPPAVSKAVGSAAPSADAVQVQSRNETRVKMNRMRLRIAQRLKDAQNTYAMLTTFNEVDMSNLLEMRSCYQKEFVNKHGVKLGLMSPFVRAAAYALQEFPSVNAVIDENEIVYRHYFDISVAVATPKGLVVPVLRSVETMDYASIEKALNELGTKAREGKLAIEDMEGGTFTISNGGVFGSVFGTPIINPPQSAILGMHGIFDRPWAVNGKVEVRPIMTVALTYDHRVIDGREAVSFLKTIKQIVEDPRRILMKL